MRIFDEEGNCLGEFIADKFEDSKDRVSDSFSISWILGILCLLWQPIWGIVLIAIFLISKAIWSVLKLAVKSAWWIIRLPFCLLFERECPEFY